MTPDNIEPLTLIISLIVAWGALAVVVRRNIIKVRKEERNK
jgi:hypothetical protein